MHILNRRKQPIATEPQWMRLAFACSFCSMYAGVFTAFAIPELAWASVVGLIPGFVTLIAAHFHDWGSPL
jgi:hypothetical protein